MAGTLLAGCFMTSHLTPPLADEWRDVIYRAGTLLIGSEMTPPLADHRAV
jgi:hypothetical protein